MGARFWGITATVLAIVLAAGGLVTPARAYEALVGSRAADFTGWDIVHRETVHLEDYLGQWVFVEFTGTWCGPCMRELPEMLELTRPYVDAGRLEVIIIGVDPLENLPDLRRVLRKNRVTYPVLYDGGVHDEQYGLFPVIALEWGVHSCPSTFLINPQGVIVANHVRGSKLAPSLAYYLDADPPPVSIESWFELHDDGSISLYAHVANPTREPVQLKGKVYLEKLFWDEHNYWQDIQDISGSPMDFPVIIEFDGFGETTHEFFIPAPAEEWHSLDGCVWLTFPGTEGIDAGKQLGLDLYSDSGYILTVDIECLDNGERIVTPKPRSEW